MIKKEDYMNLPKACRPTCTKPNWDYVGVGPATMFKCKTCGAMTDKVDDTLPPSLLEKPYG